MSIANKVFRKLYIFSDCNDKEFVVEICPRLKSLVLEEDQFLFEYGDTFEASNFFRFDKYL